MSRILLLGYIPPPLVTGLKIEAAHYRTWQFLAPLLSDGHTVSLCVEQGVPENKKITIPDEWSNKPEIHLIPFGKKGWIKSLQEIHDQFVPDCILAVNFYPCLYATRIKTDKPIWMDIYGDMLTIIQAACNRANSNRGLLTTMQFNRQVLQRGDSFSVCGVPQQHMLVGELGAAGRLNSQSFGYLFVEVVLPGAAPLEVHRKVGAQRERMANLGIRPQDFIVLWCGGYNTWTDVETLYKGLVSAMAEDNSIHFVSLGANTYEAPNNVYQSFLSMIASSEFKDNFHMLGWRPWSEIPDFYSESDLGINIDALHYETIYGTRTRLLEMMAAGLPVITSLGSELSYRLRDLRAALVFEIGDWQEMANGLCKLSRNRSLHEEYASNALAAAQKDFSFENTTLPIRRWVKAPKLAPDHQYHKNTGSTQEIQYQLRSYLRQALWYITGADK
jgi:glycosyltransferase involved in cell wall biosynthesis